MQLTELLYQRVKELGERGALALKAGGYSVVVSSKRAVRFALQGALFLGPDDARNLVDGAGPTRVGAGLSAGDGAQYRLLRELGQGRHLQRLDPETKKFAQVTDDDLEIDSFLRVECGLPTPDVYAAFWVLDAAELPSQRMKPVAAPNVDQGKAKLLREELELTRHFDVINDRLFKVQERLQELKGVSSKVDSAQAALTRLEQEAARSIFSPEQQKQIAVKAARYEKDLKKRDDTISEIIARRQDLAREGRDQPDLLVKDPLFACGVGAGLLLDVLAFVLRKPTVALLGLLPYAVALIAVMRWIEEDELDAEAVSEAKRLKEREESVKKAYNDELLPLKAAMKAAGVEAPLDLLEIFQAREEVGKRRDEARAQLDALLSDPEIAQVSGELPDLNAERQKLEAEVMKQGFVRPVAEIEQDIKSALGLAGDKKAAAAAPEAEVPAALVGRAADVLQLSVEEMWTQSAPRFSAYLTALTDKRIVSGKPDAKGQLVLTAADGRGGPYQSVPQPLKDLCYLALRLTLLEKAAAYKKVPILVDDAFASLEPGKRALAHKMLKGISALTQVVHRTVEAPPPGVADTVVQGP